MRTPSNKTTNHAADSDFESFVIELASLHPIEYERKRSAAAERLKVRVSVLDRWVKAERDKISSSESAVEFEKEKPWNRPVSGQKLFLEIRSAVKRHTVLAEESMVALVLFIMFTHAFHLAWIAPILALLSPVKRCGKTTVLGVMEPLVLRAMTVCNITAPSLFHTIEMYQPTLLVDEGDTFLGKSDELNGIINSGHSRTSAYVIRMDNKTSKKFSTWCPKAFAAIGDLPETMQDRAIVIRMRRKRANETIIPLREADPGEFETLKAKIVRWVADNQDAIAQCNPQLPDLESDRAKDNWVPLLSIAECISAECAEQARAAAIYLSQHSSTASLAEELLADIREVFETKNYHRVRTSTLIYALCSDAEKPWASFHHGRPITPKNIAQILRGFGIVSKRLRKGDEVAWGYELSQFEDVFARYVQTPKPSDE